MKKLVGLAAVSLCGAVLLATALQAPRSGVATRRRSRRP